MKLKVRRVYLSSLLDRIGSGSESSTALLGFFQVRHGLRDNENVDGWVVVLGGLHRL